MQSHSALGEIIDSQLGTSLEGLSDIAYNESITYSAPLTRRGPPMLTLGVLLQKYLVHLGARSSRRKYEQVFRQYFDDPAWRDKPANDITRFDVLLLKQQLAQTPSQADKVLGLIKQAYSWAGDEIDQETRRPLFEGQNPAWRINKHDYIPRERLMSPMEIRLLLDFVDFLSPKYQALFVCRLLVPGRIKELCEMKWDYIDEHGRWLKKYTKNKRPQFVMIPSQALYYIRSLPREGEYVFMGQYGHHLQEGSARKVWGRVRKELGMPDLQLLDFRRTLASYLYNEIEADDLTAKAVLNHYDGRPVAIYTRLAVEKIGEIIQAYADWIWNLKTEVRHEGFTVAHPARNDTDPGTKPALSAKMLHGRPGQNGVL